MGAEAEGAKKRLVDLRDVSVFVSIEAKLFSNDAVQQVNIRI